MPIDYSKYPKDWKAIRARVLARCDSQCECRGHCGSHDHRCERRQGEEIEGNVTQRTVLTLAHTNDLSADGDAFVLAMCQGCHLRYDAHERSLRSKHPAFYAGDCRWVWRLTRGLWSAESYETRELAIDAVPTTATEFETGLAFLITPRRAITADAVADFIDNIEANAHYDVDAEIERTPRQIEALRNAICESVLDTGLFHDRFWDVRLIEQHEV